MHKGTLLTVLLLLLILGEPQIVAPFPDNIYAIEYETAKVECSVQDTNSSVTPDKIEFFRKGKFGELKLIIDEGKNGRRYYESTVKGKDFL